jgi:hypothetical protein
MTNISGTQLAVIPPSYRDYVFQAISLGVRHKDIAKDLSAQLGYQVSRETTSQTINRWRNEQRETMLQNIHQQVAPTISTDLDKVGAVIDLFAAKTIQCVQADDHKNGNLYANTLLSYIKFRSSTVGIGDGKPVKEYADHLQEAMQLIEAAKLTASTPNSDAEALLDAQATSPASSPTTS